MNEIKKDTHSAILKNVILILLSLFLINPVVLFLISGSIYFSVFCPLILISVVLFLWNKPRWKILSVILFNLIFVISLLIHSEAVFTFRFGEYIIEDLYDIKSKYYFNRPYLNQTFRDKEFVVQYNTNSQGYRIGSEDDAEVTVNKADWLFIGDSYTQGAQVQFEELFTAKLFNYFPNKIIVNAGISGMGIADEYNYFINEGKDLKPKKVFLQICNFNDFMNVNERSAGFSDYLMHYSNFARFVLYGFKYANPEELPLGRWTEPFYNDRKLNEDFNIFFKKKSDQKIKDLRNFSYFLNELNKAVNLNGGELIIIQIPTKEQVYYKYFEEVLTNFEIDPSDLDMQYPNQFLDSLCGAYNINHIDLLNDFMNTDVDLFFHFDEHLNSQGHDQIAMSVSNYVWAKEKEITGYKQELISGLNVGDRYPNFVKGDCNSMIYQSFRDGNMEVFISDSELNNSRRITWNNIDESHPTISPGGNTIALTEGNQATGKTEVVLMNLDGSNRKFITHEENTFGAIPSFNGDGTKMVYAEWRMDPLTGFMSNPYIVLYDFYSDSKTILTDDLFEHWRPIFSADGNSIYYISKEENNQFDIFEQSLKSNLKSNITKTDYEEWDIALSKEGKQLAFAADKDGNWDIFLYNFDTSQPKQLTHSLGNEWDLAYSPCGEYLYFSATYGFRNGIFRFKLID